MTYSTIRNYGSGAIIASLVFALVLGFTNIVNAGILSGVSDTMTRLRLNQSADHSIVFTLPGGINWDSTGGNDDIIFDFPEAATDFAESGTWQTSDFTANDGSLLTVSDITVSAGSLTYPTCGTGVVVAVDTTNLKFGFRRCTGASADAAAVTIGILGASGGTGTLSNGTATGSKAVAISMTDEGVTDAHTGNFAVSLVDDDSASITASITPALSFDIDTATSHIEVSGTPTPYSVAMGTLTPGVVKTSDDSTINSIFLDLGTNASVGAVVTLMGANGGLKSVATNHTITTSYGGSAVDLNAQPEGFGVCVKSATASEGALTAVAPYNGSCNATTHNIGGIDTTTARSIITTTNAPAVGGDVEIMLKAKAQAITPAAVDYSETLTFIATGTF